MKDRILKVMEHEGLSSSKFADAIGIQRSAMSHIMSGRNNPSLDVLIRILERFTYIDSDWLLLGKGSMLRDQADQESSLFPNTPENRTDLQVTSENPRESVVETSVNTPKQTVIEHVICQEKPPKLVSKIMVFYSDNTFDTFVPEKSKKE